MRWTIGMMGVCVIMLGAAGHAPAQGTRAGARPKAAEAKLKAAEPIPRPAPDPEAERKVDALLAEWESRSETIQQLDATFKRIDTNWIWKEKKEYAGRALLKAPNLACLDIHKIDPNPDAKVKKVFHERIICTGEEVVQYEGVAKQITIYPLAKADRKRALEEGPLPFLFHMRAEEVKKRYQMVLKQEGREAYRIQIIPLEDTDREAFAQALIDLNKKTFLPDALQLLSPNGKETQTYLFTSIKSNEPIDEKNFKPTAIKDWKVVRNPEGAPRPARQAGPAADADPRQPAMRPKAARPR